MKNYKIRLIILIVLFVQNTFVLNHLAYSQNSSNTELKGYQILPLPYLFTTSNRSNDSGQNTGNGEMPNQMYYSREYIQTIYPESYLTEVAPVLINGNKSWNVHPMTKNKKTVDITEIPITLAYDGYQTKDVSTKLISVNVKDVVDKPVLYMHMGSSSSVSKWGNFYGEYEDGGWNHVSFSQEVAEKDAIDFGVECRFKTIGHNSRVADSRGVGHFTYKGEKHSVRSFNPGVSGTGIFYMCLYPISVQPKRNPTDIADANVNSINALAVWDFLGLGTKQPFNSYNASKKYVEPVGLEDKKTVLNEETMKLVRTTPFGKYHYDYTERLYTNLVAMRNWTEITGDSLKTEWTNSKNQKKLVDQYISYIIEKPSNPFYSFEKVQESNGKTAFSFNKYLERYRSLDDTGKRLYGAAGKQAYYDKECTEKAKGYKIGTKVNETTAVDVCVPTHYSIWYGHTDWTFSSEGKIWSNIVPDHITQLQEIISQLKSINPDIYIGLGWGRLSGALYPERWNDEFLCPDVRYKKSIESNDSQSHYFIAMNEWAQQISSLDSHINYVPIYAICPVATAWSGTMQRNLAEDRDQLVVFDFDNVHGGLVQQRCVGYQYYAWILYTLAKK